MVPPSLTLFGVNNDRNKKRANSDKGNSKYGSPDGLQLQEVAKPIPKDDEVLVKIRATTITAGDAEIRRLQLPLMLSFPMRLYVGIKKPTRITILGQELAGEVVAVGKDVTRFKIGDQVFWTTGLSFGAYAEYICLSGESMAIKPACKCLK